MGIIFYFTWYVAYIKPNPNKSTQSKRHHPFAIGNAIGGTIRFPFPLKRAFF